eukprot:7560617-Heterocapsa_arctica.AAC.1
MAPRAQPDAAASAPAAAALARASSAWARRSDLYRMRRRFQLMGSSSRKLPALSTRPCPLRERVLPRAASGSGLRS